MNYGQGSIGLTSFVPPAVIPAPTVTAANNGTSLNGTTVNLGDGGSGAGAFLSNRELRMNGFTLKMRDGVKESEFYPAGIGTHLFTTDSFNGQLLVLNGHNTSAGINAFMSMAMFSDTNRSAQLIMTNSNYAFVGGFQGNEASLYASGTGAVPNMNFITDAGGSFFFCPGGLNRATALTLSMFGTSRNVRIGTVATDPGVKLQVDGDFKTGAGAPLTAAPATFRFGSVVAAAAVLDATRYVETVIGGALVKLAIIV